MRVKTKKVNSSDALVFCYQKFLKDKFKTLKQEQLLKVIEPLLKERDKKPVFRKGFYCYFFNEDKTGIDEKCPFPVAISWCSHASIESILNQWIQEGK